MAKKKENKAQIPKPPKVEIITPKMPKKAIEKETFSSAKKVKSDKPVENLYQSLAETERSIAELSRIYAELPDSNHFGIGGKMAPTLKQEVISEQLRQAQTRAQELLKLIKKEY